MDKKYAKNGKSKAFLKRNMYYIIMGVCILAIGAMITVALLTQNNTSDPVQNPIDSTPNPVVTEPEPEPVITPEPIVFRLPVSTENIIKDYAMDTVVWWSTLKLYRVHNGIDYAGTENDSAVAAYKGTVSKVGYDALNGHYVEINHGDGLVSYYSSLSEPVVAVGQAVQSGTVLGNLSASSTAEMVQGPHVHFSVFKNGVVVSPYDYYPDGDK